MADLHIREAEAADLEAVLSLYRQPDFNGTAGDIDTARGVFDRFRRYPFYRLYVAKTEGEIVGTFCLLVMDNIARSGTPSAIIESVVVSTERQGEAIGQAMMTEAFRIAAEQGAYKICLFTGSNQPHVHAFYERLGFERHGVSYRLELERRAA